MGLIRGDQLANLKGLPFEVSALQSFYKNYRHKKTLAEIRPGFSDSEGLKGNLPKSTRKVLECLALVVCHSKCSCIRVGFARILMAG